jgi:hypothetical protein
MKQWDRVTEGEMFNYSEVEQVVERYEERLRKVEAEHLAQEIRHSEAQRHALRPLEWTLWILGFQNCVRTLPGAS